MTRDQLEGDDIAVLLRGAVADVRPVAPTEEILAAGRRRVRRRRVVQVLGTAAVVCAVAVLVPVGLAVRHPVTAAPPEGCPAVLTPAVLPEWARGGFTDPEPIMPFVLGDNGRIAAIEFGTLTAPPAPDRSNKILWATQERAGPGPLTITATLGGTSVSRVVPDGPGPSTIDLPAAGCWELRVTWAGGSDTLRLRYGG